MCKGGRDHAGNFRWSFCSHEAVYHPRRIDDADGGVIAGARARIEHDPVSLARLLLRRQLFRAERDHRIDARLARRAGIQNAKSATVPSKKVTPSFASHSEAATEKSATSFQQPNVEAFIFRAFH